MWKSEISHVKTVTSTYYYSSNITAKILYYKPESIPDEVINFINWPNPSVWKMGLGSIQHLTEMSTRNLPGGKGGRPAINAHSLAAICEPTV
jgi:hypothetical protein